MRQLVSWRKPVGSTGFNSAGVGLSARGFLAYLARTCQSPGGLAYDMARSVWL